ncbi:MAG: CBS domain-containing protein [Candidatus Berkiellales bacterium]
MQTPLSALLKDKGYRIYSISAQATCQECATKLNLYGIGAMLVMDNDKLEGIISERDFVRKLMTSQKEISTVKVAEIMTKELITVPPTATVQEAMRIVTQKRIRHLPVIDHGKLLGLISIGDLTRWVMLEQEQEIAALTGYIHGTPR